MHDKLEPHSLGIDVVVVVFAAMSDGFSFLRPLSMEPTAMLLFVPARTQACIQTVVPSKTSIAKLWIKEKGEEAKIDKTRRNGRMEEGRKDIYPSVYLYVLRHAHRVYGRKKSLFKENCLESDELKTRRALRLLYSQTRVSSRRLEIASPGLLCQSKGE